MTVSENTNPKIQYEDTFIEGQELPIPFPYVEREDVKCLVNNELIEYNTDYTVFNQTLTLLHPYGKAAITLFRETPLDQQAEFPQNNRFNSAKLNASLDKICMQQQEQEEALVRSLKPPISAVNFDGTLPIPEGSRALKINADASGFEMSEYDPDEAIVITREYKEAAEAAAEEAEIQKNQAAQLRNETSDLKDEVQTTYENNILIDQDVQAKYEDIQQEHIDAVTAIQQEHIDAVTAIQQEHIAAITAITEQETTSKNNIETKGTEQIELIQNEGTTQIANVQATGQTEYNKIITTGIDNKASIDLDNLSEVGEKHFLNKNQITNCILEAPNGVATYTSSTITVKQGLKVLIPDGRNADGTLKNKEYTLPSDVTFTTSETSWGCYNGIFFIGENISTTSAYTAVPNKSYVESDVEPKFESESGNNFWFDTKNNLMKFRASDTTEWNKVNFVPYGIGLIDNGTIKNFNSFNPISLATLNDVDGHFLKFEASIFSNVNITTKDRSNPVVYDLSSYLPNDGKPYLVLCRAICFKPANSAAGYHNLQVYTDLDFRFPLFEKAVEQKSYNQYTSSGVFPLIVGADRKAKFYLYTTSATTAQYGCTMYGYRRVK